MSQTEAAAINPIEAIRLLRPLSGALLARTALYVQLIGVEWAEQTIRLSRMMGLVLLGFASVLCAMLFAGILVTALCWDSGYRIQAIVAVTSVYAAVAAITWYWFKALSARGDQAFIATREELTADIALIKSFL